MNKAFSPLATREREREKERETESERQKQRTRDRERERPYTNRDLPPVCSVINQYTHTRNRNQYIHTLEKK